MRRKSRTMAVCGVMTALSVCVMLMGGVIPLATYCAPMLASLVLIPVIAEAGRKMAMAAYAAAAMLSLLLGPDKEAALLFAFLGWYPAAKWSLDRIRQRPLRMLSKLGIFNAAIAAMLACMAFVLNMQSVVNEYAAMTGALAAVFLLTGNVCMLLFDRLVLIWMFLYLKRLRPRLMRGAQ